MESGGVVFGAAFDGSQHLRHTACFRKEELWRLRGAKYVQSDLGGSFSQVKALLEEGTAVLFSGVPCQIDGLYRYLVPARLQLVARCVRRRRNIPRNAAHPFLEQGKAVPVYAEAPHTRKALVRGVSLRVRAVAMRLDAHSTALPSA